jgi:hypothetical protein
VFRCRGDRQRRGMGGGRWCERTLARQYVEISHDAIVVQHLRSSLCTTQALAPYRYRSMLSL